MGVTFEGDARITSSTDRMRSGVLFRMNNVISVRYYSAGATAFTNWSVALAGERHAEPSDHPSSGRMNPQQDNV